MRATVSQYASALLAVYAEAPANERRDVVQRFLARLRRERRLKWLPAIIRVLEQVIAARRVVMRTARPLKRIWQQDLEAVLAGASLTTTRLEPRLLGGLILEIGDKRLDSSLWGRIQTLAKIIH